MKKSASVLFTIFAIIATSSLFTACDGLHVHEYGEDWAHNEDYHWHACKSDACSSTSDKAKHDFVTIVDENGNRIQLCTVCQRAEDVADVPVHEHAYKTEYSYNEDFHWYACTTYGCTERYEKAEHSFGTPEIIQEAQSITRIYTCEDCGYEKTDVVKIDSVIKDETTWDSAFSNLELMNFTMDVYFYYNGIVEHHNYCEVTDTSAYYHIEDGMEFYTAKNTDGTCTTYYRSDEAQSFMLLNDTSDTYLVGAQTETIVHISFADYFEYFTYNEEEGTYTYDGVIRATVYEFDGEAYTEEMYCYNNVVKVADGKITYIACDYYFVSADGTTEFDPATSERTASFIYANIGMTEVSVPKSVTESAIPDNGENYQSGYDTEESSN